MRSSIKRTTRLSKRMMSSSVGVGGRVGGGGIVDGYRRFWLYNVGWDVVSGKQFCFFCLICEAAEDKE